MQTPARPVTTASFSVPLSISGPGTLALLLLVLATGVRADPATSGLEPKDIPIPHAKLLPSATLAQGASPSLSLSPLSAAIAVTPSTPVASVTTPAGPASQHGTTADANVPEEHPAATLPAQRLRLDQAINAASNSSPEVGIAVERAVQAREGISEAFGERLPQVDLSLAVGKEYNNPAGGQPNGVIRGDYSDAHEAKVTVQQLLFNGGRSRAEVRRRENLLVGSNQRAVLVRYRIAQQTVDTFLNIYEGQQSLAFVDLFVSRLEDLSAKMDLYAAEGNASQTLQKYVSSRLANARQTRVQLLNNLQGEVENYRFLTESDLDLNSTKLILIQPPRLAAFGAYQEAAKRFNPELQASVADLAAAQEDVRKGFGAFMPTVNLYGEYDTNKDLGGQTDDIRAAELKLKMNYKLFDGLTRNAALRRLKSQVREKELLVERIRRKNDQILTRAWQSLQASMEEEKLVRQELEDSADVRNLRQQEFEEGEGDLVRLVETEEKLFAAARQKLKVDSDILLSRFELEFTSGQPDLSGQEMPLPYAPFAQLTSYSTLLGRKAQTVPLAAVSGTVPVSVTDVLPVSMTVHVPVSDSMTTNSPSMPTPEQVEDAAKPEAGLVVPTEQAQTAAELPDAETVPVDATGPVEMPADTPVQDQTMAATAVYTEAPRRLVIPDAALALPVPVQ